MNSINILDRCRSWLRTPSFGNKKFIMTVFNTGIMRLLFGLRSCEHADYRAIVLSAHFFKTVLGVASPPSSFIQIMATTLLSRLVSPAITAHTSIAPMINLHWFSRHRTDHSFLTPPYCTPSVAERNIIPQLSKLIRLNSGPK